MFDWEDQELANIIWGEADEHIVTYPEESEKKAESVHEDHDKSEANVDAENSKPSEQKSAATKTKLQGCKVERNDELSLLASNSDLNSIDFLTGKKSDQEKGPEISESQNEDGELGDMIGNSWANIESFEDLDQIFSNDELVDHASLDSTEEFWASSGDVLDSAVKSSSLALDSTSWGLEALGNSSDQFGFNSEYLHPENPPFSSSYEKETDSACYTQQMLHPRFDREEIDVTADPKTAVGMTGETVREPQIAARQIASTNKSVNKNWSGSNSKLKPQRTNTHRRLRDAYSTWRQPATNVQQFDASKSVADTRKNYMPSVFDHQKMPQAPYQQIANPYFATYPYGNISDQCTAMPTLPATDEGRQPIFLNPEACLSDEVYMSKSTNAPIKPQKMTPQEKIEKLRRRQQMRAMLAIQKQQQQLSHQVPVTDYSIAQRSSLDDQTLSLEGGDFKSEENIVPTYDPNSPLKQDDSSTISVEVDDHNVEDTVLYQLQDTVTKMDMNTRLCIRDSLFRLAQSATQRHSTCDSSTANRNVGSEPNIVKEDINSQESFMRVPNAETETNQIDRAVAHLLFHRPMKSSSVKNTGTAESSISQKIPPDLEMKVPHNVQNVSSHISITPRAMKEDLPEQPDENMDMNQKMKQKMVESAD